MCGTDVHMLHGMALPSGLDYPLRPGHEVCGMVVEVADDLVGAAASRRDPGGAPPARRLRPLRRLHGGRTTTAARYARMLGISEPGGMADEVVWPVDRMVPVIGLAPLQAALLPDAVATAYHALRSPRRPLRARSPSSAPAGSGPTSCSSLGS